MKAPNPHILALDKHVQEAIKLKLIRIENEEDRIYVVYKHNNVRLRLTDEEKVRVWAYMRLTVELGYPFAQIRIEHKIKVGSGYKRADILVTDSQNRPLIVLECKRPQSDSLKMEEAYKQLKSYADLERAPYLWLSNYTNNTHQELIYHGKYTRHKDLFALPPFAYASRQKFQLWVIVGVFYGLFRKLSSFSLDWKLLRNLLLAVLLGGLFLVFCQTDFDWAEWSQVFVQAAWGLGGFVWLGTMIFVLYKITKKKSLTKPKRKPQRKARMDKARAVARRTRAKTTRKAK